MDNSYEMIGCLDFETNSYAISVPVLRSNRSNYLYIPKTDHHFIVTDFYEVEELGYKIHYIHERRLVSISQKTPVPILDGGSVYIVDADWTDAEIRGNCPGMDNETVKAFVSLRARIAAKSTKVVYDQIGNDIEDLLVDPVRSKYWISRFSALVRSAFESGRPDSTLVEMMEAARLTWMEKYATKTSLKLVTDLMQVQNLTLQGAAAKKILLRRFEGILMTKGINLPATELQAHRKLFPEGILPAIRAEGDQYEYWRRGTAICKMVNDQLYKLLNPSGSLNRPATDTSKWSLSELKRLLSIFEVLGGDDLLLDQAAGFFQPLFDTFLENLDDVVGNREDWRRVIHANRSGWIFKDTLSRIFSFHPERRPASEEDWLKLFAKIDIHVRKTVILQKIISPHLRKVPEDDIAFDSLDYNLLHAMKLSESKRDILVFTSFLDRSAR
ncbi:hypothetical protein ACO34A_23460 (plasmid) [Rhizobium sp. ACO-34A]|nr:hypothetical protein [Rhizobium sp. ACO-34A]ATN36749.1 hypothetical protein ACO34A_23460 [Rhizobium sp. ACO-34A]